MVGDDQFRGAFGTLEDLSWRVIEGGKKEEKRRTRRGGNLVAWVGQGECESTAGRRTDTQNKRAGAMLDAILSLTSHVDNKHHM
jgi:hypothetical protein